MQNLQDSFDRKIPKYSKETLSVTFSPKRRSRIDWGGILIKMYILKDPHIHSRIKLGWGFI